MRLKDNVFYSKGQLRDTQTKINYLSLLREFRITLDGLDNLVEQEEEALDYNDYTDYHLIRADKMRAEGLAEGLLIALDVLENTLKLENEGISKKFIIRHKGVDK